MNTIKYISEEELLTHISKRTYEDDFDYVSITTDEGVGFLCELVPNENTEKILVVS